jgi:hypothetical protein
MKSCYEVSGEIKIPLIFVLGIVNGAFMFLHEPN